MKRFPSILVGALIGGLTSSAVLGDTVMYPKPRLVSESTGLMESYVNGEWFRGSAVIARNPKLLFSCAHLFYDRGRWATDYNFYRACHQARYPTESEGVAPRGMYYFTSYSSGVKAYGGDSEVAFASDFTVLYGNSSFGPAASCWVNGGRALRSTRSKRVVGYPTTIDFTGAAGNCYQHVTGPFSDSGFRIYGPFHEFDDVSTGPGNSGGPVFVRDGVGHERLAGILVSGTRRTAGVVGLNKAGNTMASRVLGMPSSTVVVRNSNSRLIPDGGSYITIPMKVSGVSGSIGKLNLSLSITTKNRGDLDVYLRSPNGRIHWISKRQGGTANDLILDGKSYVNAFGGDSANGTWELRVRDAASRNVAWFEEAALLVGAL